MSAADKHQTGDEPIPSEDNPYQSPNAARGEPRFAAQRLIHIARTVVLVSWAVTFAAFGYGMLHAADGDPHQWDSAIATLISLFGSLLLTAGYALVSLLRFT